MAPSAWTTAALAVALAHGPAHAAPAAPAAPSSQSPAPAPATPATPAAAEQPPAPVQDPAAEPGYVVHLDPGPDLARRMGTRVVLQPTGDNAGRNSVAIELPSPATADDPPTSQRVELPAGIWRVEVTAPGFLASTREFTVDATRPDQTLRWDLLLDTLHATVRVPVTAAGDIGSVTVTARTGDGSKTWTCTTRRATCQFRLARGRWAVETHARGFASQHRDLFVPGPTPIDLPIAVVPGEDDLAFAPGPTSPVARDIRKRAVIGLSAAAAPLLGVGLGLTVAGRKQYVHAIYNDACAGSYGPACGNSLITPVHMTGAGVGLLGVTAGQLITGLTGAFDVPAPTWWALLGVGGGLSLVGAAWVGANTTYLDRDLRSGPLSDINARVDRRLVASALLGLGLGTSVSALTHALVLRRHRKAQLAPYAGAGQAGLVLSGRF